MLKLSTIIPPVSSLTGRSLQRFFPLPINSEFSGDKIEKNEMGGACCAYGEEERLIQGFGGET